MSHIIETGYVKTRKEHSCAGCERKMPAGSKMNVVTYTDGDIFHAYWCEVCQYILNETIIEDEFIMDGEVRNGNPEYWEKVRKEIEGG